MSAAWELRWLEGVLSFLYFFLPPPPAEAQGRLTDEKRRRKAKEGQMATNSITISDIVVVVEEIKLYAGDWGIQLLRRDQQTSYCQSYE